jgi:hypothetical protein
MDSRHKGPSAGLLGRQSGADLLEPGFYERVELRGRDHEEAFLPDRRQNRGTDVGWRKDAG